MTAVPERPAVPIRSRERALAGELDAPADLRRVVITYRDALRAHQDELNRLNVYPVPTATPAPTWRSRSSRSSGSSTRPTGMDEVCEAISHGSLMGARGNSGVILSQILRGLADTFSAATRRRPPTSSPASGAATDAAYQAVLRPVEGTILTVVRAAAEAVEAAYEAGEATLAALLDRAAAAARDAVQRRPSSCRCSRRPAWSTPAAGLRAAARRVPRRRRRPPAAGAGGRDDAAVGRGPPPRRRRRRRSGTR